MTAATGTAKMAPDDALELEADEHRHQDHHRVDAHGVGHDPRLDDVHDHEPAHDHDDEHRAAPPRPASAAATTTGGAQDTKGPKNGIIWRMATMTAVAGQ